MKFILFFSILLICFHVFADAMYNGEFRTVKDYPFMVQLSFYFDVSNAYSYCGATILSNYWVISAAHCFRREGITTIQVRTGSSETLDRGTLIDVDKVFIHGDYYPDFAWDSDIALVKLKTPIDFSEYQQPIQITKSLPQVGDNIIVLGFGSHHHGILGYILRAAETSVIEDKACIESFDWQYSKNMICTNVSSIDLCFGDSGGPAVHDSKLIGVISQGCEYTAKNTKPNILVKIANFYDWIMQTTGIQYIDQ